MRLDEGFTFQKLSLDLTPLIDIVFLLVLFFAVSTSFISREDLAALKNRVDRLSEEKAALTSQLGEASVEAGALRSELALADRNRARLETSLNSLTEERDRALGELDALGSRLAQAERDRDRQIERVAALSRESSTRGERIQDLQQQLNQASSSLARERKEIRTLEASLAEQRLERQRVEEDLERANQTRTRLDTKLGSARSRIEKLEAELAEFKDVAALDRKEMDRMLAAQQILQSNLDEVMQNDQLNIKREDRLVILQLSDRILFDSGSAAIKAEGVEVLKEVGNTIKSKLQGMQIQVAGHTDNVPVSPGQGAWSDNWSLSAARAVNVLQLLESQVGIDPELLSAAGYGEHRPIADNDSAAGRARNRRIELVLVPR